MVVAGGSGERGDGRDVAVAGAVEGFEDGEEGQLVRDGGGVHEGGHAGIERELVEVEDGRGWEGMGGDGGGGLGLEKSAGVGGGGGSGGCGTVRGEQGVGLSHV